MNAIFILGYVVAAIVCFCRGLFWEGVALLGLAEFASLHERLK